MTGEGDADIVPQLSHRDIGEATWIPAEAGMTGEGGC